MERRRKLSNSPNTSTALSETGSAQLHFLVRRVSLAAPPLAILHHSTTPTWLAP